MRPWNPSGSTTAKPHWKTSSARLLDEPRYGLDTEFHGERTYWPRLALIQIAWPGGLALVDPLTIDARRLAPGAGRAGLHGRARRRSGPRDPRTRVRDSPTQMFDTQVAAGFLGLGTPSLVSLVEQLLGVRLGKGDRLTDWTRRPLTAEQRTYAAADVEHLLELQDVLVERLEAVGRLDWALDECEDRRQRVRTRPEPEAAWWRIKGARATARPVARCRAGSRGVARAHRRRPRRAAPLRALRSRARGR